MKAATSNTSLSSLTASVRNSSSASSTAATAPTVPNPRNTIFVVGFPRSGVNSNDFKFFFERSIPGAKVNNAVIHKGHSRRIPGQEDREPGTPFAFVVFETEAAVPAAVNLNQKMSVLAPAGDMFANIKIERVGMKNRVKNSLYVTGFRYSDSVQDELKTFFEENLFEEGTGQEVEVDVYPVVMTSTNDSGEDFLEQYRNNDKSYAFIFFPDHDSKHLALASLQGMTVGHHGTLDLRERSDEQKQRRKCQCQQQHRNTVNNKPQPQLKQIRAPFTDQQCDPFASSSTSISSSSNNSKTQQQQQQVMNKNNNNTNKKENNKWSRTTFGSSLARMTQGCSAPQM